MYKFKKSKGTLPDAFVISIRPERALLFRKRMKQILPFMRSSSGVDGRNLNMDSLSLQGRVKKKMKRGVVGCFMSHRRIWKWVLENKCKKALIMEDDAVLLRPFISINKALNVLNLLDSDWDILLLGRNPRKCQNGKEVAKGLFRTGPFWGMFAYIISQKGVQKLLPLSTFIHKPVDVLVSDLAQEGILNVYALTPETMSYVKEFKSDTFRIV